MISLVVKFAGYTGTVLLNNGKLSDLIGELQVLDAIRDTIVIMFCGAWFRVTKNFWIFLKALVKGLEKSGDSTADSDPIAAQVRLFNYLIIIVLLRVVIFVGALDFWIGLD